VTRWLCRAGALDCVVDAVVWSEARRLAADLLCTPETNVSAKPMEEIERMAAKKSPKSKGAVARKVDDILDDINETLDDRRARQAVPTVDEDGIERPSVEVHEKPAGTGVGTRYLKCELTDDEILCLRVERETEDEKLEELQLELATVAARAKSIKQRIDAILEDGLAKSKTIRLGYEWRNVPCEERRGADLRTDVPYTGELGVATYRLDTGECIEWRELTDQERQGKLFDEAAQ
jgi:hypothetical protein